MHSRPGNRVVPLLTLIERRFGVRLSGGSVMHLQQVHAHYLEKRQRLLWEHGMAGVLARRDYAKAVLISETARLMLHEIDPWPRAKRNTHDKISS